MEATEARILKLRKERWRREFVFKTLWDKLQPGAWSSRDRKIILDRTLAKNPTVGSYEACINRVVSEFLRKRDERKITMRVKDTGTNPVLEEFLEKYSPRSKDPDIQFITIDGAHAVHFRGMAAKIWRQICKTIPDRPSCERFDVFSSTIEAFIEAARTGNIQATSTGEVEAWIKKVTHHTKNRWLRKLTVDREHLAWDPTRPEAIERPLATKWGMDRLFEIRRAYTDEEGWDDGWLENKDVSRSPGSQYSDSFEYGQHPEVRWDRYELSQVLAKVKYRFLLYAHAKGVKRAEQVRLFGRLMGRSIPENIIKKALENGRADFLKRAKKVGYLKKS